MRRILPALAATLALPLAAAAQTPPADVQGHPPGGEPPISGAAVVHDNDNLPHPGNTLRDDNYSAAYEFRINGRLVRDIRLSAPLEGLDWLTRIGRLHARGARRYHSVQLLGVVYTPDRIQTPEVQTDDRPYASLVLLNVSRTSVGGAALDRLWSSELAVGMLGLELPGDVQRLLHRTRRWMTGKSVPVDPLGWPNQISAGGEPTGLYRVGYQRRLWGDGGAGRRKRWEVVGGLDGGVGYTVTAAAALSARVGAFTSEFWEFPRGVSSTAVGQQGPAPSGAPRWDLFTFALVRPRVVAYDALVQGQFRHSAYTVPTRHLLGEWEGGIGTSLPARGLQLQLVVQFAQGRTADFERPKARNYTWGTVGLFVSRRPPRAP
ncbi:MAG: DUF2219 family protein [Vicinamibacterales bacterium]